MIVKYESRLLPPAQVGVSGREAGPFSSGMSSEGKSADDEGRLEPANRPGEEDRGWT